jgi:transposase
VRFALTAAQKGDAPQTETLLKDLPADVILADAAYDSDRLRKLVADLGAKAVIPDNPSRAWKYDFDKALYKARRLVERCSPPASDGDHAVELVSHALDGADLGGFRSNERRLPVSASPDGETSH